MADLRQAVDDAIGEMRLLGLEPFRLVMGRAWRRRLKAEDDDAFSVGRWPKFIPGRIGVSDPLYAGLPVLHVPGSSDPHLYGRLDNGYVFHHPLDVEGVDHA